VKHANFMERIYRFRSSSFGSSELCAVMNSPDQDTLVRAIEDARRILAEHSQPDPRDPARTVELLLVVLDRDEVVLALDRIGHRRAIDRVPYRAMGNGPRLLG
jgi:hypothetical protein